MSKLVPIKYSSLAKPEMFDIADGDIISKVNQFLFIDKFNYVLVGYNNELFICEAVSDTEYKRRAVNYHPLKELVLPKNLTVS